MLGLMSLLAFSVKLLWLFSFSDTGYENSTVVAHAGDGNFHTLILFDPNNEEHRQEAERLNHFMVQAALSMEGIHLNFYDILRVVT